jgi:hypothetical protein
MSSTNRDILTVYLPICIPLFLLLALLVWLGIPGLCWIGWGEWAYYLVPDFRENGFSFYPLSMMLAIGLSYIAFIMLSQFLLFLIFFRAFIMKWYQILSKAFSASIEIIMWFLSLLLLMCWITFIDLHMLNYPSIPGMKSTWSWWMISDMFLDLVCHNFIEDFCIYVH